MPSVPVRRYVPADFDAVRRIWLECGWIEPSDEHKAGLGHFLDAGSAWVAEVGGSVEAFALGAPASARHTGSDLPAQHVAAVTVGRVARGRGLAGAVTARLIAEGADDGAVLSFLGIFDQGYYDKLGYGTGNYFRFSTIDPAALAVPRPPAVPVRLGPEDAGRMIEARRRRMRVHGAMTSLPEGLLRAEWAWTEGGFGVGFEDADGRLTHHVFVKAKGEEGPYHVKWFCFDTYDQLVELLGVVASWRDQVMGVRMYDPPGLQLQDLVRTPLRGLWMRRGSDFAQRPESFAWWQVRVLDVGRFVGTIAALEDVRFVVDLDDPVTPRLARVVGPAPTWTGVGGSWVVTLGATSTAEPGDARDLPRLTATVGAFSRLLYGVATAQALSVTDDLRGDPALLAALDRALRLPAPNIDWDL